MVALKSPASTLRQSPGRRQHREFRAPPDGASRRSAGADGCTQISSTASPPGSSSSAVGCAACTGATRGPSLSGNRE